jgi:IS1 family transposase
MNKLSMAKQVQVISALLQVCSVRSTSRMTGVAKGTILRLLAEVATACAEYQARALRNIPAKPVQVDEISSFVGCKQKNVTQQRAESEIGGDVWTFVAIEAQTRLAISWLVGRRDAGCPTQLLENVAGGLANRVQLTTDGHKMYLRAVVHAFARAIDYAQFVEIYGHNPEGQKRYSPAQCPGTERVEVIGSPDPNRISTSFVERQNLTMRMQIRRFTRLTNGFSKKIENHTHAVALFYMWYNFGRIHQTLQVTPAMEAGISNHVSTIEKVISLTHRITCVAA